jgi:hypothetical protein
MFNIFKVLELKEEVKFLKEKIYKLNQINTELEETIIRKSIQNEELLKDLTEETKETKSKADEKIKTLNHPGATAPILLIKIGDKNKGWIPGGEATCFLVDQIKEHKLDQQYNILFFTYAIETAIIKDYSK